MLTPNTASDNPKMEADLILHSFYVAVIVCEGLNTASIVSQTSLRRASLSEEYVTKICLQMNFSFRLENTARFISFCIDTLFAFDLYLYCLINE